MAKDWKTYEEVSREILDKLHKEFGLIRVEGKQKLIGKETGIEWEIDAKGVCEDGEGTIIIECRRYKTSRQSQEKLAGFAYRIRDVNAQGGILVSPLGLQKGAKKIAQKNNILSVEIDANSTPENFAVKFLNKLLYGVTFKSTVRISGTLTLMRNCRNCGKLFTVTDDERLCGECSLSH